MDRRFLTFAGSLATAVIALSGCIGSAPQEIAPQSLAPIPSSPADEWVSSYWGEARELAVLDADIAMTTWDYGPAGEGWVPECVRPEEGSIVPPGTQTVLLSLEYAPPATAPEAMVEVYYETAAAGEGRTATMRSGDVIRIALKEGDADAPGQPASFWFFCFRLVDRPAGVAMISEGHVTVTAERAEALPRFPEAGDPLEGREAVVLVPEELGEAAAVAAFEWDGYQYVYCDDILEGNCKGIRWEPEKGALVPPGATKLRATLSSDLLATSAPRLMGYRHAAWIEIPLVEEVRDDVRVYELALEPEQRDSLHQGRSLWETFTVFFDTQGQGAGAARGALSLEVLAVAE